MVGQQRPSILSKTMISIKLPVLNKHVKLYSTLNYEPSEAENVPIDCSMCFFCVSVCMCVYTIYNKKKCCNFQLNTFSGRKMNLVFYKTKIIKFQWTAIIFFEMNNT